MSSQLTAINGYPTVISAAGTVAVHNRACTLNRVLIPGTFVGTVVLHDSATAAGTNGTSNKYTLGLPGLNHPESLELGMVFKHGFTYEASGTPTVTVVSE